MISPHTFIVVVCCLCDPPVCFYFSQYGPVVDIDLMAPTFVPGKANYERVKQALSSNVPLTFDFVLTAGEVGFLVYTMGSTCWFRECRTVQQSRLTVGLVGVHCELIISLVVITQRA